MTDADLSDHFLHSSLREKVIEHLFVGDLLRALWRRGDRDIEVLRAEVDRAGYDLVFESRGVARHIQLKSSHRDSKTRSVKVHTALGAKPCGCVVWIRFEPATMELGPFLFFGGAPGNALPSLGEKIARHTKANAAGVKAERAHLRIVDQRAFSRIETVDDVARALFG